MRKTTIIVRTTFEGVHSYPEAPDAVKFLRHPHRHEFAVEAEIEVFHNDRDLEFLMVKDYIETLIAGFKEQSNTDGYSPYWQMGRRSCEDVATILIEGLGDEYGWGRSISVSIFEDGQNGAKVQYTPGTKPWI